MKKIILKNHVNNEVLRTTELPGVYTSLLINNETGEIVGFKPDGSSYTLKSSVLYRRRGKLKNIKKI